MRVVLLLDYPDVFKVLETLGYQINSKSIEQKNLFTGGSKLAWEYFTYVNTAEELKTLVRTINDLTNLPYVYDGENIIIVNDWI